MVIITHTFEDNEWQQFLDDIAESIEFSFAVRRNPAITPKDFVTSSMFTGVQEMANQAARARITKAVIATAKYPDPIKPASVTTV